MTKNQAQFILGILVAIMPALGFPHSWTYALMIIMALAVSSISFLIFWQKKVSESSKTKQADTFLEKMGGVDKTNIN